MRSRTTLLAAVCAAALTLAACDGSDTSREGSQATGGDGGTGSGAGGEGRDGGADEAGGDEAAAGAVIPELAEPPTGASVLPGGDPVTLSSETGDALFAGSPVVVLVSEQEQLRGASAAVALGVPVLVDGPGTAEQLDRLGAEVALAIGAVQDPGIDVVVPGSDEELAQLLGIDADAVTVPAQEAATRIADLEATNPALLISHEFGASPSEAGLDASSSTAGPPEADDAAATTAPSVSGQDAPPLESDRDELPATAPAAPMESVTVLSTGAPGDLAALGSARAAGARVLVSPHTDPRATSESVQAWSGTDLAQAGVLALGQDYGTPEDLTWKVAAAATGVELPGGGQLVLPGKTYVALYGSPVTSALGVLGHQPIEETVTRAEETAGWYEDLTDNEVIPTMEIIVSVASEGPGADNQYSNVLPISDIEPLVDLASEAGHYVVLDLQPGRTDFVTQAKIYEDLLLRPNVGLALDPEWRLGPDEVHMVRIGHVEREEVDAVVTYLADLTREHDLPQKMLVLHMFQNRMIPDVDEVDQSREEVAVLIHADGQGGQGAKQETWRTLHAYAPSIEYWGWKNFTREDHPMLSPEETMDQVDPVPDFISYQ